MKTSHSTPMVTVIVPLYNKEETILRALNSILAQDYVDFEVIVINDGSTDRGYELVQLVEDPRIRCYSQSNAGPGAARNAGARLSCGAYLTFLDADDEWFPTLLTTAMAKLHAHPRCSVFTAAYMLEPLDKDRWSNLRGFYEGEWTITPDIPTDSLMDCMAAFHSCTCVYQKEAFEAFGGFYEKQRCTLGEDVYLWLFIILNLPIYRHMTPLAVYHMEASELGIDSQATRQLPLEPVLTDTGPIYDGCPPKLAAVLDLWLAQHAWRSAALQLQRGNKSNATILIKKFPLIRKKFFTEYLKLRVRLIFPQLWNQVVAIRKQSR